MLFRSLTGSGGAKKTSAKKTAAKKAASSSSTTEIYTLSLHDALPISLFAAPGSASSIASAAFGVIGSIADRSTAKRGGHNSPFDPSEPQLIAGSTGAVTAAPERRQARDSANPDHGRLS